MFLGHISEDVKRLAGIAEQVKKLAEKHREKSKEMEAALRQLSSRLCNPQDWYHKADRSRLGHLE